MEEQTARNKQAEARGLALLVSAQNMGIPAHSSSVPVSTVGAAAAQLSFILPFVQHDSEAAVGEKCPAPDSAQELQGPSVGVLPLHMIEEETTGGMSPGNDFDSLPILDNPDTFIVHACAAFILELFYVVINHLPQLKSPRSYSRVPNDAAPLFVSEQ